MKTWMRLMVGCFCLWAAMLVASSPSATLQEYFRQNGFEESGIEEWAKRAAPFEEREEACSLIYDFLQDPGDHSLNFSRLGLNELPDIWAFPLLRSKLVSFDCSNNNLRALPQSLGNLSHLECLNLSDNLLADFPYGPKAFPKLMHLHLSCNLFQSFPSSIQYLGKLDFLGFESNVEVPQWVHRQVSCSGLLVGGPPNVIVPVELIEQLPKGLLDGLNVWVMGARDYESRGRARKKILQFIADANETHLSLNHLGLQSLPDVWGFEVFKARIRTLNCAMNQLDTLPETFKELEQLQVLDLVGNRFSALPEWLAQMQLQSLRLNGNPCFVPTKEEEIDIKSVEQEILQAVQRKEVGEVERLFHAHAAQRPSYGFLESLCNRMLKEALLDSNPLFITAISSILKNAFPEFQDDFLEDVALDTCSEGEWDQLKTLVTCCEPSNAILTAVFDDLFCKDAEWSTEEKIDLGGFLVEHGCAPFEEWLDAREWWAATLEKGDVQLLEFVMHIPGFEKFAKTLYLNCTAFEQFKSQYPEMASDRVIEALSSAYYPRSHIDFCQMQGIVFSDSGAINRWMSKVFIEERKALTGFLAVIDFSQLVNRLLAVNRAPCGPDFAESADGALLNDSVSLAPEVVRSQMLMQFLCLDTIESALLKRYSPPALIFIISRFFENFSAEGLDPGTLVDYIFADEEFHNFGFIGMSHRLYCYYKLLNDPKVIDYIERLSEPIRAEDQQTLEEINQLAYEAKFHKMTLWEIAERSSKPSPLSYPPCLRWLKGRSR